MKKIFLCVSAVFIVFVVVFVGVLTGINKNIGYSIEKPSNIIIYNQDTNGLNGKSYEETDKEYNEILEKLEGLTTLSLFELAKDNNDLNYKIEYDSENYASYDTSMKKENLCVELMYKSRKNLVVYDDGMPRVIPYSNLIFIVPLDGKFEDIVVYSSLGTGDNREAEYKQSTPFILKGVAKDLIKYVNEIKE